MFLGKVGDSIVSFSENKKELEDVASLAGFTDIIETEEPVMLIEGAVLVGYDSIKEVQSALREKAYVKEVDGITAHIDRLRDEEQTEAIIQQIEKLKTERQVKVAKIKEQYPYPQE